MRTKSAACCLALLLAGTAYAQEPEATEEKEAADAFSDEIVVTATRDERSLDELPVSATVIGRDDIDTAPVTTTDELLRTVPGVNMPLGNSTVNNPLSNFVSMRGLGGARALVLLDGEPLNDSFFGFVSWDRSPLESVQKVEVVRGGGSSLFGNYALGGVINIVTRPIAGRALELRALGGSDDTYRLNLYGSQRIGERLGLGVSANRFDTDGYIPLEPAARGAIDVPARSEATNVQLKAEHTPSDTFRWFARVNAFDQEGSGGTRLSRNAREALGLAAGASWSLGEEGDLEARAFHQDQELTLDNTDVPFFSGRDFEFVSNAHVTPSTDTGASLQWTRGFEGRVRSLLAGVDLRRIDGEDRARNFNSDGSLALIEVGGGRQTSAGLFAEVSVSPFQRLEVLLSARYDHWENADGERRIVPGGITLYPDKTANEINPRLALRYELAPGIGLRAAAYRAFRAPNLDELYRSSSTSGSALVANPELDPEILVGAEAGFDLIRGPLRAQVNVFRNDVEDQITFVATRFFPVFTLEVQNVGESRSQGVETLLDLRLASGWTASASYTWTDTEILSNPPNPSLEGKKRVGVPEDYAALSARYVSPATGWTVSARGRYSGARFVDLQNTLALEAHEVFDLLASYPLGSRFEIFGIAENVLDEEYAVSAFGGRILGAPRQVFGGVRWSLR